MWQKSSWLNGTILKNRCPTSILTLLLLLQLPVMNSCILLLNIVGTFFLYVEAIKIENLIRAMRLGTY